MGMLGLGFLNIIDKVIFHAVGRTASYTVDIYILHYFRLQKNGPITVNSGLP